MCVLEIPCVQHTVFTLPLALMRAFCVGSARSAIASASSRAVRDEAFLADPQPPPLLKKVEILGTQYEVDVGGDWRRPSADSRRYPYVPTCPLDPPIREYAF